MNEMLFIDGQMVDLGEDTNITLNFKSNIFADLSKIVGNNSYTIRLPKTVKNMRIIGNADAPASSSEFPRSYHECRYFRNGVEIVSNGRAVLLSVGDAIEIAMAWGNTSGFATMVEDGKNLDEVAERNEWIYYAPITNPNGYGTSFEVDGLAYVDMDLGLKADEELAAPHPSVRSGYIFNLLKSVYGVTFEFPTDKQAVIDSLVFPLLTRNGGYANMLSSQINLEYMYSEGEQFGGYYWGVTGQAEENDSYFKKYYVSVYSDVAVHRLDALKDSRVIIKVNARTDDSIFTIEYGSEDARDIITFHYDSIDSEGKYVYDTSAEIDMMEGDYINNINAASSLPRGIETGSTIEVMAIPNEIQVGDRYPIVDNLPSIKTVDFIKAIASMLNMFAVPNEDGSVIKFVSVDDLADISRAYDWSDKLLPYSYENKPKNVSYALDDFARNNRFSYKEDDTVLRKYKDGNITVNDDTLDFERDAVELPFAASDTIGGKARIALYEYNDDGEPELQSVEPRVLREISVNGYSTGTFAGLSWGELIANYYGMFQRIVASPVVVVDNFLLNDIELKELDYTRPVYLRQYGRYFAIVEIKAPSSGACECKLLELDI